MTAGGWVLMLLSCSFVTGLLAFCYTRLLRSESRRDDRDG